MFTRASDIFRILLVLCCTLVIGTAPAATAASSGGALVSTDSNCFPYGTSTLCVKYRSILNSVSTPNGGSAYTQKTTAQVTATSADGNFLYSTSNTFQNQYAFQKGESRVNVAFFSYTTEVPGFGTCTQEAKSVFSNGELHVYTNSYTCTS